MKVMFAYEHKFCRDGNGQYFSSGQFPYRLWQRYLNYFDEIVVVGRVRALQPGESLENMDLSSGPGVNFVEVPSINDLRTMLFLRADAVRTIKEAMIDCDALIVRTSGVGQLAAEIAEKLKKPWAVEVVGCAFDSLWNHGSWQGKLYAPIAAYSIRKMINKAPYAIYVTREFLQKRYPCRGHSVGCSDVQLIKSDAEVLENRIRKIEQKKPMVRIGLIGSLVHSHKGIATALQALGMVRDTLPTFQFCILGGGNPRKWRDLADHYGIAAQTVFCGTLSSGAAVNSWLDDIDLYLQPSLVEGLPRALIEAMNRGCPALGSSVGGIPELLAAECIHKAGDALALAELLEKACSDKAWQIHQATRNFRAASRYDSKLLENIRREFWLDFVRYCETRNSTETKKTRIASSALMQKTLQ